MGTVPFVVAHEDAVGKGRRRSPQSEPTILSVPSSRWRLAGVIGGIVVLVVGITLIAVLGSVFYSTTSQTRQEVSNGLAFFVLAVTLIGAPLLVVRLWSCPALRIDSWGVCVRNLRRVDVPWEDVDRFVLTTVSRDPVSQKDRVQLRRRDGTAVKVDFGPTLTLRREGAADPFSDPNRVARIDHAVLTWFQKRWQLSLESSALSPGASTDKPVAVLRGVVNHVDARDAMQDVTAILERCHLETGGRWQPNHWGGWFVALFPGEDADETEDEDEVDEVDGGDDGWDDAALEDKNDAEAATEDR
jgi:hypothetical protein